MRFDVTVLGCGAATPTMRYNPTSQVLNIQEHWYLLDAGEGVQKAMRRSKIPFHKVHRIFISHLHGDHVLGLPGLVGSMNLLGRTEPLHLHGPKDLKEYLRSALSLTATYLRFPLHFYVNHLKQPQLIFSKGELEVTSFPAKHRIEAYGYHFSVIPKTRNIRKSGLSAAKLTVAEIIQLKRNESVTRPDGSILEPDVLCLPIAPPLSYVFSGDTAPNPLLIQQSMDAQLLYHESTFTEALRDKAKATGHSTALQAAKAAQESGVGHLLLGHFSSRYRSPSVLHDEAQAVFANTSLAVEGKTYRVQDFL